MSHCRALEVRRLPDKRLITDLCNLRAGDECLLSGPVYTVRDATCKRLIAELDEQGVLPYNLAGKMLFYAGPTPPRAHQIIGSIGPTTARRMDRATARLMDAGIIATLGKGSRTEVIAAACERVGGIYFGAIGGIAALGARHVIGTHTIAYEELGTESLTELTLKDFPVFVALDTLGDDWYKLAPARYLKLRDKRDESA